MVGKGKEREKEGLEIKANTEYKDLGVMVKHKPC